MRRILMLWSAGLALVWAGACSDANPGPNTSVGVTSGVTSTTGEPPPAPCVPDCTGGLTCCDGVCTDINTDPTNCGMCFNNCPGPHAVCINLDCEQAPCMDEMLECEVSNFCCGTTCCAFADLCCAVGATYECTQPDVNGACPL
jgi:Stigma-specific protein, Stig1